MRKVPRPLAIAVVTFAFPILVSASWILGLASLGESFISTQIALLALQIQRYFWSEADYHEVKYFLFGKK